MKKEEIRALAEEKFKKYGLSAAVQKTYEIRKDVFIKNRDAHGLQRFKIREQQRSIDIYERSIQTALKLNLPVDKFYDMYVSKDLYKTNKILSGMTTEAIIKIINFRGCSCNPTLYTEERCELLISIDGQKGKFTLTKSEALAFPSVQERLQDPTSYWATFPKEALLSEAVLMLASNQFLRFFTPVSKVAQETKDSKDYRKIAEGVFAEQIYNLSDAAYESLESLTLQTEILKKADERQAAKILKEVKNIGAQIKKQCIEAITKGLEIADRLQVPREIFFGISGKKELDELIDLQNIKQKWFIDLLRQFGTIVIIEKMSRHECRLVFEKDGEKITRTLTFDDIKDKKSVKQAMESEEDSFIQRRMELHLFYDLIKSVIKEFFCPQFLLKERRIQRKDKKDFDIMQLVYGANEDSKEGPVDEIEREIIEEALVDKITETAFSEDFEEDVIKQTKEDFAEHVNETREKLKDVYRRSE